MFRLRVSFAILLLLGSLSLRSEAQNAASQGIIIGIDTRETIQQRAQRLKVGERQVRAQFSATGRLVCPSAKAFSTAQLVILGDLIVTTAQAFYPTCNIPVSVRNCYIEMVYKTVPHKVFVQELVEVGDKCIEGKSSAEDWAVAKLERPIQDVIPVQLVNIVDLRSLLDVHVVNPTGGQFDRPEPLSTECGIRDVEVVQNRFILKTDCDAKAGARGSALLAEGKLAGIVTYSQGIENSLYDPKATFTQAIPISGRLRAVLERFLPIKR